jgi:LysM repeat protein
VSPRGVQRNNNNFRRGDDQVQVASHKVRRGETVTSIARRYKISNEELMRANNLKSARSLRSGQTLKIPGQGSTKDSQVVVARNETRSTGGPAPRETIEYTVKRGDTLSTIAARHKVSVSELQEWNKLSNRSRIHPGTKLRIHGDAEAATVQVAERVHEVRRGEYAAKIAAQYGIEVDDLLTWNNKSKDSVLRIGEKLVIRGAAQEQDQALPVLASAGITDVDTLNAPERTHVVKRGEYPSKIAEQYGVSTADLLRWNDLDKQAMLRIGDKLVIRGGRDANLDAIEDAADARLQVASMSTAEQVYEVKAGDYPAKIASIYGVPLDDLLDWNQLSKDATLQIGDKLVLKGAAAKAPAVRTASAPAAATEQTSAGETYTVQPGDSAFKIAKAYKLSAEDLLRANGLQRDATLRIGQKLQVPGAGSGAPAQAKPVKAEQKLVHVVAKGDTASTIAGKYRVKVADLLSWNNLTSRSVLKIGQELTIHAPANTKVASAASPSAITHVVRAGHNPTSIARQYGVGVRDLYQWNGWPEAHVLHIGDEVTILKP